MASSRRIGALDGLRGVAALAVVVTHIALAGGYVDPGNAWPVWAGKAAVLVFFVLSGFVLTLPLVGRRRFEPLRYYPSRAVRLYVPVWGALVVAAALHLAVGWEPDGSSAWLTQHARDLSAYEGVHNAILFQAGGSAFFTAIWSLKWEIVFSVLLPVFVWLAGATRRIALLAVVAALALIVADVSLYATYLPVFFLGSVLAFQVDAVRRLWAGAATPLRAGVGVATVVLLLGGAFFGSLSGAGVAMIAAGATLLVALATVATPVRAVLEEPRVHWLGTRSFSLYLIHEPVVVSIGQLDLPQLVGAPLSLALALLAAEGFFRLVERPSHGIARSFGSLVATRFARDRAAPATS